VYFKTNDIYLAAFLQASGFPLQANLVEGSKTIFCYEQKGKLLQLVEDYYNMKASINPLHYGGAIKILKNILYQKNNNYTNDNHQSGKVR
jgi:hypothetical protein